MIKKFNSTKEFKELQTKWYKKLKRSGFIDLEWYNPKTGIGHGTPYLKAKGQPTNGDLAKRFNADFAALHQLYRNFLGSGPFYPNLKHIYTNSNDLQRSFRSFPKFLKSYDITYTRAEYHCLRLLTEGNSIRKTSKALRRLHHKNKLGKPPKRWGKATKGQPYSVFWVKKTLDKLKKAAIDFERLDYLTNYEPVSEEEQYYQDLLEVMKNE